MRAKRSDLLLLVLNQFIWGVGWSAIKYAQKQMGPVTLNVWSLGISVVTLIPFLIASRGSASSQVLSAAQMLSGDSDRLKVEVARFLNSVRAA